MTSIPAAICRIYRNNFKRHYLKNKRHFGMFFWLSEMCIKFRAFSKKNEYPSLIISQIIDAETRGYLCVWKVLLQNTIR